MGVIFVAGVYAVGKTTACAHAAKMLDMAHYTASSLIKAEKATAIPKRGKIVADIGGNQSLLIRSVQRVLAESGGRIILDGHFTLLTSDGRIERVETEVFRALGAIGVVVYHDEPAAIAARFRERDGDSRTLDVVAHHQNAELMHARHVTAELDIPLLFLNAFDATGLTQAIKRWSVA